MKQALYRTAVVKNHVHTQDGAHDLPEGTCVAVRYVGQAIHRLRREMMHRYLVSLKGEPVTVLWECDLTNFVL